MGIDLTQLLAAVTGGAQGMAATQQQDEQRKRQQLQDALAIQSHAVAMDKMKSDALHQQNEDYKNGIRVGHAPDAVAANGGLDVAANVAGMGMPGVSGVAPSLAVQAMRQASPETYSPTRFQQINPQSYVDTTATPEAVADRARVAADQLKQTQARGEEDRKVHAMIGAKLPDGRVIDEPLARAMVANSSLGAAYARPPQAEQHDHFQVSTAVDAQGHPIVINTATGEEHSSTGKRPVSGQAGQASVKEKAYSDLMANAYPTMEALAGKIRPTAISLAIAHPTMGNAALSPDEQAYMNAARNFIAGALHLESGARLSKEQWAIGLQRYVPALGDTPATVKAKTANAKATLADRARLTGMTEGDLPPGPDVRNDAPKADPILEKYNLAPRKP